MRALAGPARRRTRGALRGVDWRVEAGGAVGGDRPERRRQDHPDGRRRGGDVPQRGRRLRPRPPARHHRPARAPLPRRPRRRRHGRPVPSPGHGDGCRALRRDRDDPGPPGAPHGGRPPARGGPARGAGVRAPRRPALRELLAGRAAAGAAGAGPGGAAGPAAAGRAHRRPGPARPGGVPGGPGRPGPRAARADDGAREPPRRGAAGLAHARAAAARRRRRGVGPRGRGADLRGTVGVLRRPRALVAAGGRRLAVIEPG